MSGGGMLIGAIALALVIGYLWYATIVARRNKVNEALGSIDVHLRQRHELIPNVVRLAGRFMEHERGLMEAVTRLRVQADQALAAAQENAGACSRSRTRSAARSAACWSRSRTTRISSPTPRCWRRSAPGPRPKPS